MQKVSQLQSQAHAAEETVEQSLQVKGHVYFDQVTFCYPSRCLVKVLNSVSLDLKPGTTNALVGASGAGKSTVLQLMLRFYDPTLGKIMLDGVDMCKLSSRFVREHIGLVSQEPVLFATSIMENIRYVCTYAYIFYKRIFI